jgi:hypothetical protein
LSSLISDYAQDPIEYEADAMGFLHVKNAETESNECRNQETPRDIAETMRSLKVEIRCYRADNERLIKAQ